MHCLQLTKFYPPVRGGIETIAFELASGLIERGHSVDVLCSNNKLCTVQEMGERGEHVTRTGALLKVLSTSISPRMIIELVRRRSKYQIIHVQFPDPMAVLALLIARPQAKIIIHWQSDIVNQRKTLKLFAPLQQLILKRASTIVCTSKAYATHSKWLSPFANKVRVIPLGIGEPEAPSASVLEKIKDRYAGRKIVFSLGRMTEYKGFNVLIQAAAFLPDDVIILVGGGGSLLTHYRRDVVSLSLQDRVDFLGELTSDEAAGLLHACDVFCLPSVNKAEAFGIVLLEAMAAGKPIVTTNIPGSGVPWVNRHMVSGINVPPGDANALALAIMKLLSDQKLYASLAVGGRARYLKTFTATKMVERVERLYKEISSSKRK